MMDYVKEKKGKKISNYPNTKKPLPISIVTGPDTIFVKTKPNKLASNYINSGNQIKNNKILINSINHSSEINKSLKNTFSLHRSNLTKSVNATTIETKNLNYTKFKIKKLLNNNIHKNINYRGTNSFIKMNRRNNNSNITYNINNSVNHIFNFYTFMNKGNNKSSEKGISKIKHKFDKNGLINRNSKNKKNNFNFENINDKKNSMIVDNSTNSKGKRVNTSINRTSYPQRYNYINNLNNITFKNYKPFRTIGYETENNYTIRGIKSYGPSQKFKFENKKSKNNKYIYSIEKKKEKSLAEKRHDAKKPISYLSKNNIINKKDKDRHMKSINKIKINNINNNFNNNANNKEKEKNNRITSFNRIQYDFSNTNYKNKNVKNKNYDKKENSIRIKINNNEIYNTNNTDINIKTSLNNNKKISLNNKKNLERNKTIENNTNSSNNIVNNNNYYSINNTFIFDTAGHKLIQYDLSKLLPNSKNNHSMNINISDISNYNSSISNNLSKTNNNDIGCNDNKIINKINKAEHKVITKESKINKVYNNNDYISVVINNNINNGNIQKYSSNKISNIIKDKINRNQLDIVSDKNKFIISNIIKKESTKTSNSINHKFQKLNNNNKINSTVSKDIIIKEYNIKKKKEIGKNKILLNNKESTLNRNNNFHEQKSITNIYNNNESLFSKTLNRRKSDNICNYKGKSLLNKYNINNLTNSKYETTNNSIQADNTKVVKDNYNSKEKDKKNEKIKDISKDKKIKENRIISYKIKNFKKYKNNNIIININNSHKIRESKLKKEEKEEKDKTKNIQENKRGIKKEKKLINNNLDINNKFFNDYETCGNNNENKIINVDSFDFENIMNKEQDKNDKNYTSFELISLSENMTKEDNNNKFVDIPDNNELFLEDNFDDINSIIKKIDFYSIRNNPDDIFSINNNKYKEYSKKFDKLFDNASKFNKKKNFIKKIN